MKPKDLKCPYSFEARHPLLKDGVFYVPAYYQEHAAFAFPSWIEIFGNENPVMVEFCSGNGAWIIEKAQMHPEKNWIAVEKQFKRVRKIYSKRHNLGLSNLFIVSGEALTFVKNYLKEDCIEGSFVNFPDPWPKDRHAKHRLIQEEFVSELKRVMNAGGSSVFVTDHADYAEQMQRMMEGWKALFERAESTLEGYGGSYFQTLWRSLGRTFFYLEYCNEKVYAHSS